MGVYTPIKRPQLLLAAAVSLLVFSFGPGTDDHHGPAIPRAGVWGASAQLTPPKPIVVPLSPICMGNGATLQASFSYTAFPFFKDVITATATTTPAGWSCTPSNQVLGPAGIIVAKCNLVALPLAVTPSITLTITDTSTPPTPSPPGYTVTASATATFNACF